MTARADRGDGDRGRGYNVERYGEHSDPAFCNMTDALLSDLSPRARELLLAMRDDPESEGELVMERGEAYVGTTRTNAKLVMSLIRASAIKRIDGEAGGFEVFTLSGVGRSFLSEIAPESKLQGSDT